MVALPSMRKLFILVFLSVSFIVVGQDKPTPKEEVPPVESDSTIAPTVNVPKVESEEDTSTYVARAIIPSIYIDYGKLLAIPLDIETKYEVGVEILFKEKIPLIFEAGAATLNPTKVYSNGSYESSGNYFRIGTGIYSQFVPKNKLGFTVRYAISSFDESASLDTENTINIPRTLTAAYSRSGINASWMEFVLYSDTKINNLLSLGMNLRFRYLLDYDLQSPDDVYSIPGYGRSFDQSMVAANLFLKVSF